MADRFDVSSQVRDTYGAPTGFRAMQTELLRRVQMEEAARAEAQKIEQLAYERQRQQAADELSRKVQLENLASNKALREANELAKEEATLTAKQKRFQGQRRAGEEMTPETIAEARSLGLGGLVLSGAPKVGIRVEEGLPIGLLEGDTRKAPEQTTPPVTITETGKYAGTPDEQDAATKQAEIAKQRQFVDDLVAGKYDQQFAEKPEELAAAKLLIRATGGSASGVAGAIASLFKPKTVGDESVEERFYRLKGAEAQGNSLSTGDQSFVKEYTKLHPDWATREAAQRVHISMSNENAKERQAIGNANQARREFVSNLNDDQKLLAGKAGAAAQLINDAKSGGVNDSTLMTGFIQMKVGGYGSGLRLSDFETQLVQRTMSDVENFQKRLSQTGLFGKPVMMSPRLREDMVEAARAILKRAQERADEIGNSLAEVSDAETEKEVNLVRKAYNLKTVKLFTDNTGVIKPAAKPPTPSPSPFKTTITPPKPK